MTVVSAEEVKYLAGRIKLAMPDAEAEMYAKELSEMVGFIGKLQEVDTEQVAPTTHPLQMVNVLRKDVPVDVLDREEMLKSVKEHEAGQIKVPTII
jgi:aspartyl-tRNA(Asn)/glutamyl-tRNA(Gln) amidotransferase subunit C